MPLPDFSGLRGKRNGVQASAMHSPAGEIKEYFRVRGFLDNQGWEGSVGSRTRFVSMRDELFFMMQKPRFRKQMEPSSSRAAGVHGLLRWAYPPVKSCGT
ncbi:hypothetical protein HAV15_004475 [Penicillium sp. str. |nr:hypothetical protein HAV15_004475 [Penicillium sp. str. \